MEGCSALLALLALIAAGVAIFIALSVRSELRELRTLIAKGQIRLPPPAQMAEEVATPPLAAVQVAEPAPAQPAPPPPPVTPQAEALPPPMVEPQAEPVVPPPRAGIDWENLIGIRLFSWIGGIAFVLAIVFLFKLAVEHGWLQPAVRAAFGILFGAGLLIGCELRVARNYRFTANALHGAGIAILYATLFSLHARWHLWPSSAAFAGMLVVTAIAVYLSTRRDSIFIALLGLLGGFATPALLSSGENRPIALFSYLLLLNGGISWIAFRKRWPVLTALSVALTAFYQWAWVSEHLSRGQLPLAAAIFLVFAAAAGVAFWREGSFRKIAAAAAVLPLLFAFFTAIVPEYGANFHVLFGFLLLLATGFAAIALFRGTEWLHTLGGGATLVTFFLWLVASYTKASWPLLLAWLAAFVALYLLVALRVRSMAVYTAPLLFFMFFGLAFREGAHAVTLTGAMFALLAVVIVFSLMRAMPQLAFIALAFGSVTIMALDAMPFWLVLSAHTMLFGTLLVVAGVSESHRVAAVAVVFSHAAQLAAGDRLSIDRFTLSTVLYGLFVFYPLLLGRRVKQSIAAHLAAILASVVYFIHVYDLRVELGFAESAGALPVFEALVLIVLLWRLLSLEPQRSRLAMVAGAVLAFLTAAIPVQLENEWMTVALALEAAALAWLFIRIPHRGLVFWSAGLAIAVFIRLVLNPYVYDYHVKSATPILNWYLYTYLFCAAAMFMLTSVAPHTEKMLRRLAASFGTIELFLLVNIEIADFYSKGDALAFNFMGSSLAQDLTYTMAWALFAMIMLVTGIVLHSRAVRVTSLGLLFVTVLKCFLHDLGRLGGLYRVGSLFGLAVSLVLVGLMLQRFVIMKREEPAATR